MRSLRRCGTSIALGWCGGPGLVVICALRTGVSFEAPKGQETSGGAAEHPVRRQLAKYRDALRGGSGSLQRRERGVPNVDRLTRIQSQAAESGLHSVDSGELRKA